MTEFILMVMIYTNATTGGSHLMQMGEYRDKVECEQYAVQIKKDLAEPTKTIRATCLPKSAIGQQKAVKK